MGEAKRRKATDPDYGKKSKPAPAGKPLSLSGIINRLGINRVSRTELIIWAVFMGIALGTLLWSNSLS